MIVINAILIMTICVLVNHLGLIETIEGILHHKLPIINCCKCATFWFSSTYLIIVTKSLFCPLAGALLLSFTAIWLELLLGIVNLYYDKIYKKLFTSGQETGSSSSDEDNPGQQMPEMPKQ